MWTERLDVRLELRRTISFYHRVAFVATVDDVRPWSVIYDVFINSMAAVPYDRRASGISSRSQRRHILFHSATLATTRPRNISSRRQPTAADVFGRHIDTVAGGSSIRNSTTCAALLLVLTCCPIVIISITPAMVTIVTDCNIRQRTPC